MSNIFKFRISPDAPWQTLPVIKGENGKDYVLTEADKQEIANMIDTSGFTTEEEVNTLINTALGVIENGSY